MNKTAYLLEFLSRGDIYYNIKGSSPDTALSSFMKVLRLPKSMDRTVLKAALIEREALGTTAIGDGIAIPHSRKQAAADEASAFVAIGFLDTPIDWNAPDGKPVTTLFLILSAGVENHLSVLSGIACLAGKKEFRAFLSTRPSKKELLDYLEIFGSGASCRA